jgi:hypothetical protein
MNFDRDRLKVWIRYRTIEISISNTRCSQTPSIEFWNSSDDLRYSRNISSQNARITCKYLRIQDRKTYD